MFEYFKLIGGTLKVDFHKKDVELFIENVKAFDQYLGVKAIKEEDVMTESDARTFAG